MRKCKRNFKRKVSAAMLAVMLMGCTAVLAANYSLGFTVDSPIKYSDTMRRTSNTASAYLRQTGSSPGYYNVSYTVLDAGNDNSDASNPLTISGTNYAEQSITYLTSYKGDRDFTAKLKGVYSGTSIHTVNGEWNPNLG